MPGILNGMLRRLTGGRSAVSRRSSGLRNDRSQRGFLLVEAVVALAIMGSATAAMLTSLSAGTLTTNRTSLRGTADWVATSQINLVLDAPFQPTPGTYASVTPPAGFAVANATSDVPGGNSEIQSVIITVTYQGSVLLTTEVMKVDR